MRTLPHLTIAIRTTHAVAKQELQDFINAFVAVRFSQHMPRWREQCLLTSVLSRAFDAILCVFNDFNRCGPAWIVLKKNLIRAAWFGIFLLLRNTSKLRKCNQNCTLPGLWRMWSRLRTRLLHHTLALADEQMSGKHLLLGPVSHLRRGRIWIMDIQIRHRTRLTHAQNVCAGWPYPWARGEILYYDNNWKMGKTSIFCKFLLRNGNG